MRPLAADRLRHDGAPSNATDASAVVKENPRVMRLVPRGVAKPWGRCDLAPWFSGTSGADEPIGEVWFEDPDGPPGELLVKLLFTAARLSVQVHPDDRAARAAGLPCGKDEAWVVLGAIPPGEIALGLRDITGLAAASRDGSIVARLDWRGVGVGDAFYSPAGTVHAIGAGLTLLEVQQNVDVTYRLYDYGSDRRLDLDAAVAVARPGVASSGCKELAAGHTLIASGAKLQIERLQSRQSLRLDPGASGRLWIFAVSGTGRIDDIILSPGICVAVDRACAGSMPAGADWLIAYARSAAVPWLGSA